MLTKNDNGNVIDSNADEHGFSKEFGFSVLRNDLPGVADQFVTFLNESGAHYLNPEDYEFLMVHDRLTCTHVNFGQLDNLSIYAYCGNDGWQIDKRRY